MFDQNNSSFKILSTIVGILMAVLIVLGLVIISNKIKENAYIGKNFTVDNTVAVEGKGEIFAKPDVAMVDFSVVTESLSIQVAMQDNAQRINNLTSYLKEKGIEDKDIKTTGFNLYPKYDYVEGVANLSGYEVSQSLSVKVREIDSIGEVIKGATDNGANRIGQLGFIVDDQTDFLNEAREQAIKEAKSKASVLASSLGVRLGKIVGFTEQVGGSQPYPPFFREAAQAIGGASDSIPQIQTGENTISVVVNVVYEII